MVQDERALRPPPISRVYSMDDREAALNHTEVAANDLSEEAIADLSTTDSEALNRLAQTERENADARDLLRRSPVTE
jgi:hypothetical protein